MFERLWRIEENEATDPGTLSVVVIKKRADAFLIDCFESHRWQPLNIRREILDPESLARIASKRDCKKPSYCMRVEMTQSAREIAAMKVCIKCYTRIQMSSLFP